ncbi:hypothetical protein PFISCL1PPCAC_4713, partial [Pristionchus fissidentatus]
RVMVRAASDKKDQRDSTKKAGAKNVQWLTKVVISKADQLVGLDAAKEKQQRKKFRKQLASAKRLIRVNIEACKKPAKKSHKKK